MTKSLFDSFDEVSAKEWKQKIQFDLKGADYNQTLIYQSLEGINIKPFYHQEDLENINNPISHPTSWKNSLRIEVAEANDGNQKALKAIQKGAESIFFIIKTADIDPKELLEDLNSETSIFIETEFLSASYIQKINDLAKSKVLSIYVFTDIIGNLAVTGNWFSNLKEDHLALEEITKNNTLSSTISIDTGLYQNAGATMVQQLAYALAHANEYLNHFDTSEVNPLKKSPIVFKVAIGGNYFFEIAKLRALRLLWQTLASAYGISEECHIFAYPSHRNKTVLDYNVNMLRTTTECMSAILGGADTIHNLPYDDIYNLENDFGTRISFNQLLILKNESYFDLVNNPASGTYYIESLTDQLAEKALSLFKNIEEGGGFLSQLKSGTIQKKIKESANKEQELFDSGEIVLTGANTYKNAEEIIPTFQKPVFQEKRARKTLLEPIIKRRLSEKLLKKS
ncbi:methylmalonyl-CoA mutase subunit beta [Aquimarina sp. MMG016]|uniref:methylmalonyl-CoA mutase subunit beta n=1 Tax=Aquimarina sp. MMG016 TaxID=2822690 RepID=UPI001B3A2547|nr:methylmalonyl-CoA mutase subunit beta [Aquimarina sp. MMG016]MBQ4822707.1 methylmalonyl-CoA mutase subunit beta [Aquimarina sp. MMG016]